MKICLPLSAALTEKPGIVAIGTCFFVRGRTEGVKLVTCAHLTTQDTNYARMERWPKHLDLHIAPGKPIALPLFRPDGAPCAGKVYTGEGAMVDLIVLQVVDAALYGGGPLAGLKIFDFTKPHAAPRRSDPIWSYGFPMSGTSWPQAQPNVIAGLYRRLLENGAHEAELAAIPGHSGGPVVDANGDLVGMAIGQTADDVDRIIPLNIIEMIAR